MPLLEQKKKIAVVFGVLLLIMILGLVWLFTSTNVEVSDLEIGPEGLKVNVKNSGPFELSNLVVSFADKDGKYVEIKKIATLAPSAQEPISLEDNYMVDSAVTLIVEGEFQQPLIKKLTLSRIGVRLNKKVSFEHGTMILGVNTKATVEICNEGSKLDEVTIKPRLDQTYLRIDKTIQQFSLNTAECTQKTFVFTPAKEGQTSIVFVISSTDFSEELQNTMKIIKG
ncbi:MAG: hypothetical protein Q7K42_05850 [Candidatus Diapherotrites archaeon]|nr:hypothetical protein [Candidatus Diapherotrites archaeon]